MEEVLERHYFSRNIVIYFLLTVALFQNILQGLAPFASYADELLLLYMGFGIFLRLLTSDKGKRDHVIMVFLMVSLVLYGIVSQILSDVPRELPAIVMDIVYLFKIFVCFLGADLIFEGKTTDCRKLVNYLAFLTKIVVMAAFVLMCVNLFYDLGLSSGVRYGWKSYQFLYSNPGMLSQYCIGFCLILTGELIYKPFTAGRKLTMAMLFAVWLGSMRSRAFIMVLIWFILYYIFIYKGLNDAKVVMEKLRKLFRPQYFILFFIMAIAVGGNQIERYFGGEQDTSRYLFVSNGLKIMQDYFPFGAGFATFGTEAARAYYSPLYYRYGMNSFWALKEDGTQLTDCYWPAIWGELGAVGFILMGILIFFLLRRMLRQSAGNKWGAVCGILYVLYLLIGSFVTGAFSSYVTAGFIILFEVIVNTADKEV